MWIVNYDNLYRFGIPGERQIAPRIYCDICEEFDAHETEDCPQQTTDLAIATSNKTNAAQSNQRAYCEICESMCTIIIL